MYVLNMCICLSGTVVACCPPALCRGTGCLGISVRCIGSGSPLCGCVPGHVSSPGGGPPEGRLQGQAMLLDKRDRGLCLLHVLSVEPVLGTPPATMQERACPVPASDSQAATGCSVTSCVALEPGSPLSIQQGVPGLAQPWGREQTLFSCRPHPLLCGTRRLGRLRGSAHRCLFLPSVRCRRKDFVCLTH